MADRVQQQTADHVDQAITGLLVRAIAERSLLWFCLLAATGLWTYAIITVPSWWKLVAVAAYSLLIFTPVLYRAWRS
jgi:hypothetical protein